MHTLHRHTRAGRAVALAATAAIVAGGTTAARGADGARYEHRVVVSTTSLDQELDVEGSLERNVNRFGAAGFEVAAIVGGSAGVLDRLLDRKPYVPGRVDHAGLIFVIMARPVGGPLHAHQYRLLHTRTPLGTDALVARAGQDGFHLVAASLDGAIFHAAFERTPGPAAEYRVYRNQGRKDWMTAVRTDPGVLDRLMRVFPMGLDFALIELGPRRSPAGALEWTGGKPYNFTGLEGPINDKARDGFRVSLVRRRDTSLDVLLVRPAGAGGSAATYDLDDGPWGMPCGRGAIAGADVFTDGDTYCASDVSVPGSNDGLDLTARTYQVSRGRLLFDAPDCATTAWLGSSRAAARRLAVARTLEQALDARVRAGYHVTRALAAIDERGAMRIVAFASTAAMPAGAGPPIHGAPSPELTLDRDEPGGDLTTEREDALNERLRRSAQVRADTVRLEVTDVRGARYVRIAGCVATRAERKAVEDTVRGLLAGSPFSDFAVRNDLAVGP
jgi:hypothetical protein